MSFDDPVTDVGGDSIAALNYTFCELTALYWIWKNHTQDPGDLVGLLHYRRLLLGGAHLSAFLKKPISETDLIKIMSDTALLVADKIPVTPNVYEHYGKCHFVSDLDIALHFAEVGDGARVGEYKKILLVLNSACMFNMFVSRRKIFDTYCEWVFPILFQTVKSINLIGRSPYQLRAIGFLAERLFNLWIFLNPSVRIKSLPVLLMHKSRLSNLNKSLKRSYRGHS